jgi:hypothetical protein
MINLKSIVEHISRKRKRRYLNILEKGEQRGNERSPRREKIKREKIKSCVG